MSTKARIAAFEAARKKALDEAEKVAKEAEAEGRNLRPDEERIVEGRIAYAESLGEDLEGAKAVEEKAARIAALNGGATSASEPGDGFRAKFDAEYDAAVRRFKDATITGELSVPSSGPPVEIPVEPTVAGLLAQASLDGTDKFTYLREGTHTVGATTVSAMQQKPLTDVAASREEGEVSTIAHIIDGIERADLDDESFLGDLINKVGRNGLLAELDDQVLNGNSTGPNFPGILNDGDVQDTPFSGNILQTLREAKKDLRIVNEVPTAVVMHPEDAAKLDELRDAAQLLIGNAGSPDAPWGVRRIESTKIAEGMALMGNFAQARLYTRQGIRILEDPYSGVGGENMRRNLVDFRFEMRAGLAVLRGSAFTIADLTA